MSAQTERYQSAERPDLDREDWGDHHADHLSRYLYAVPFVESRTVVDAGTGPGYGAVLLKHAGASDVQAVDIDAATIEKAKVRYRMRGLQFLVDDCEELSQVTAPRDVICSFENIEHLRHPEKFLSAAVRILSSDGLLLCSTPDRAGPMSQWIDGKPANPFHFTEWYLDEFRELMSKYFKDVDVLTQVMSFSLASRRKAVENLIAHLSYLWSSPSRKLARGLGRLIGHKRDWPDVFRLAAPGPADFPIVKTELAHMHGQSHALYAICRGPKK